VRRSLSSLLVTVMATGTLAGCCECPAEPKSGATTGQDQPSSRSPRETQPAPEPSPGKILKGTERWRLTQPAMEGQIAGYTDQAGGTPGTVVGLRVSTIDSDFQVQAFRFGYYRGGSAHLVWRSTTVRAVDQAQPTFAPYQTRTIVARWADCVRVDTTGWEPGAYLFRFTSTSGWQAVTPYFVTSTSAVGKVALVAPVTTWQAYNRWGGYSLYAGPAGDRRAWQVSFERPYDRPGFGEFGFTVRPVVVQAESTGVDLAYFTNLDVHLRPGVLSGARGYVSMGHDEYWTPAMRSAVETARDSGTNLAFLAANTMYWRIRLPERPFGAGRLVVGYRHDAYLDPLRDSHPVEATGRFRDPPAANPEHSLIGMQYECFPVDAPYRVVTPRWWGFAGTGVKRGTEFPHLVGDEADRVYPVDGTPRPLQILSSTSLSCRGTSTSAQSTYYTHPSGAGVFSVGTLRWTCTMNRSCFGRAMDPATVEFVRTVTRNVVSEFALGPVGLRHPALDNLDSFDLPRDNLVSAS
jgi:hypothetical protein